MNNITKLALVVAACLSVVSATMAQNTMNKRHVAVTHHAKAKHHAAVKHHAMVKHHAVVKHHARAAHSKAMGGMTGKPRPKSGGGM